MNCKLHPNEKMTLLFTSWVCDVCEPPRGATEQTVSLARPWEDVFLPKDMSFMAIGIDLPGRTTTNFDLANELLLYADIILLIVEDEIRVIKHRFRSGYIVPIKAVSDFSQLMKNFSWEYKNSFGTVKYCAFKKST